MELEVFAKQEKKELSMIEVARAILEERGRDHEMHFSDLVNEIQNYLEKTDADIREALPYFYASLNVDGSFIPLGDNKWGLRSWYAIDEIDEEIITLEGEEDSSVSKQSRKRVNAFIDDENEDVIDYSDDDPEDESFTSKSSDLEYDDDAPDDEKSEVESYDSEINEIIPSEDLDEEIDINEEDDDEEDDDDNEE